MRVFLKVISRAIAAKLNRRQQQVSKIPQKAYEFFKGITPKKTGNARKNTSLQNKTIIEADYPYANRLDKGWSKQAPDGMSQPTIKYIRKLVKEEFK